MPNDDKKSRKELIRELQTLRSRVAELEAASSKEPVPAESPWSLPAMDLARALDALPALVCLQDKDYTIRFANRVCWEVFGDPANRKCYEMLRGRSTRCDDCPIGNPSAPLQHEHREWTDPSTGQTFRIHEAILSDLDGGPFVLKLGIDITELKRTEAELRASELFFNDAQRLAHVGSWDWDIPTGNVVWSDELYRMFGLDPESFTPHIDAIMARTHPEDQGRAQELIARAIESHEPGEYEMRIFRSDGSLRTLRSTFESSYDDQGNLLRIMGTGHDVTESKQVESELRASRALLANAQRLAHVGSWEWDVRTGEGTWSDEMYRIHGRDPATFKPTTEVIIDFVHPEDQEFAKQLFSTVHESFEPFKHEARIFRPDGSVRTLEVLCEGQHDEKGNLVRIVGSTHDITERKEAERQREEMIAELEMKNAELERFTYTVSHDLKSPLITLMGFVSLLRQDLDAGNREGVDDALDRIENAGRRMDQLLGELLHLSRVGRRAEPPEPVPLDELARQAVGLLAGRVEESQAQVEIAPKLPSVLVARSRLLEVFQNLIENALKYAADGQRPRVQIDARRDGTHVVCSVRDNGQGIDPRYREKIFGLFEKLDPKTPGTGIGLAIVHRIVELHGGHIWVESNAPEPGSTFHFTLPSAG
ncbi:MAG: PAS domain-containing protein [Pirellulales bacterium]|nr:PAS domain-containing protein [Pirellulales bacterium]